MRRPRAAWRRTSIAAILVTIPACAARTPHIPEPARPESPFSDLDLGSTLPEEETLDANRPARELRMPGSRAHVLDVLWRFQSSIVTGQPPLETLVSKSAGLTAPGSDNRRASASRSAIASALGANFVHPGLEFDPFEVSIRRTDDAQVATVPLEGTSSGSSRRIVLSLEVGYDDGVLRIQDVTLSRAQ